MLLTWSLICITPPNFWFWNNAHQVFLITLITTSCLSPANNTNYLHWERCEALSLISNPGKADSQLVAPEYGWVILEKYLWKTSRAIPPGSVWSTTSSRGVISSSSRFRSSLGVQPHPAAAGGAWQGWRARPWAADVYQHPECTRVPACTHTLREVFPEKASL